ncbi:MAG TPA: D-alanine--D-alanine ligase [Polyangia bacterium]|nr:D-alanine--D-alanine ligase [Polyangia bacterium]
MKKIGVLMGGLSAEREVSLKSGEAVYAALAERGHDVYRIFVDRDVDLVLRQLRIDVAFLALHGRYGEDGCIQGLLEILGIPYTGSGVLASALAMDKVKSKEVLRLRNLPTPPSYVCERPGEVDPHDLHTEFGYPCVVKPADGGSSIGVSIVRDPVELEPALETAAQFSGRVLVERFVDGKEISVAVLGGLALGAVEIVPRVGFYDYGNKYTSGRTEYHFPARLSPERYRGVLELGEQAHDVLGCDGITRVDLIVSERGNESILEVNTIPGLTPTSLVPKIAHGCGMDFGELCEEILGRARLHAHGRAYERRQGERPFSGPERRAGGAIEPH